MIKQLLTKIVEKKDLSVEEAEYAMQQIMEHKASDSQIAALLTALRMKQESSTELAALARIMRSKAIRIRPKVGKLVDTCGTGGDCKGTFNISTVSAFVVAGCGVAVAKHGNVSITSKSGSADLLKALGIDISLAPVQVEKCIEKTGIGFLFAPAFHPAMRHVAQLRKDLGIRTIFNILGPLINPAVAEAQVIGVAEEHLVSVVAGALKELGCQHALVVHGDGLDELTITGKSTIREVKNEMLNTFTITPSIVGLQSYPLDAIRGGSPEENAKITTDILEGAKGAKRDIVLLNAAAALVAADKVHSIIEGIELAKQSIDTGKALEKLDKMRRFSNAASKNNQP